MNTPSHWLMTMAGAKWLKIKSPPRLALALGSIAPDLALGFLSFGGIWYFRRVLGWSSEKTFPHLFKNLFYNHPGWIIPHNLFHSPTSLILMISLAWFLIKLSQQGGRMFAVARWALYFLFACLFHSMIDIVTHFDDGPLLLFPFNWSWRFSSPVSYWDPAHFGRPFMFFEAGLDLLLIGFLVFNSIRSRKKRKNAALDHDVDSSV